MRSAPVSLALLDVPQRGPLVGGIDHKHDKLTRMTIRALRGGLW